MGQSRGSRLAEWVRRRFRDSDFRFWARLQYELIYLWPTGGRYSTFNFGTTPADPDIVPEGSRAEDRLQLQLYRDLFRFGEAAGLPDAPLRLVEVGAGLGGGLDALARIAAFESLVGIEPARSACFLGRRRFRVDLRRATAEATGLPDASCNMLMVVDSLSAFPNLRGFFEEMGRVLTPGALVLFAMQEPRETGVAPGWIGGFGRHVGLRVVAERAITDNVRRALRDDQPRRARMVLRVPFFLRSYARELFVLEGSVRYAEVVDGRRSYFFVALRKDGPEPQS
ncbi:MAG: methyltransferase domain-containing protein [Pseudomonadota bacterium]